MPIRFCRLLATLSLLLFGIIATAQTDPKRGTFISGTVTDEEGRPLDGAKVTLGSFYALTVEDGSYEIEIPHGNNQVVYFTSFGYEPDTTVFSIKKGERLVLNKSITLMPNILDNVEIVDKRSRFDNQVSVRKKEIDAYVGAGSSVEGIIKTLPGVSSYSELSSQYSVRGGNFDENLVYVNGIEIYRPFLVSNGQQEGLSFVNGSMVENVDFSAGGFEARYGDKMASVLDITYRQPKEFAMRAEGSLLGGGLTYENLHFNKRLSVIVGARYRTNQLLLGSLDTEGDFKPSYTDIQAYLTYYLTDEWELSFLGNYSRNKYEVVPASRTTDFGTFQEALRLNVYFDGREDYDFVTRFGALTAVNRPSKKVELRYTASAFQTTEQEYFDVIAAYSLGELNNNLGSDDFGEISFVRGVGGFQNYARNNLDAIVANVAHDGFLDKGEVSWRWGLKFQVEDIIDRYKEWEMIDSAGYNVPHNNTVNGTLGYVNDTIPVAIYTVDSVQRNLELFESYDSRAKLTSYRVMAYVERSQLFEKWGDDFFLNVGLRSNYWTFNQQNVISPRASFSWKPDWEKDMVFRFATGYYYQPPFYREMRDISGGINEDIKAQQSIHFVLGNDYQLKLWNRPFKMVTEVYYKSFDNLIPYNMDNVRIRYTAENNSKGYAAGIDYRLNGEFVQGVESWASISLMTIQEDIEGDGVGYVPRPTDQRVNFKIFFQDYLPRDPTFRVSGTVTFGTGLPFGPPEATAEQREDYRLPPYRRVDLGFTKDIILESRTYESKFWGAFKSMYVTLEVFNLFATNNTISYLWVKDISTAREYAVPNYLTGRLLNLRLVCKF